MPKASRWPPYGSNFSSGTTDAIGVLVETFNDCEQALRFILLAFMGGDIRHNYLVVEQMSSTAVVGAIQGYLAESKHRKQVEDSVQFAIKSFETCLTNRNSIIHLGMAWREVGARKTRLFAVVEAALVVLLVMLAPEGACRNAMVRSPAE